MGNLKRFTTQYKSAEDRFLLTGEDKEGATVSLWLTQRLLLKTVPVLVDWLQKYNSVDLTAADNSVQAQQLAKVFSRKPVVAEPPAVSGKADSATAPLEQAADPILVHSIDLNLNEKMLRMRFKHDDQELGILAMNGSQLRQWLAVLHVLWKKGGWPAQIWPRWLIEDTKLATNKTQGAFH